MSDETRLFGSSGVRGIANQDLTPSLATQLGLAITTYAKDNNKIIVARDTRVSGIMLENALVSGLLSGGAIVERLGIMPTPTLAFLTRRLNAGAGVMITASHNPPPYNGIKIFDAEGMAYDEEDEDEIEKILKERDFRRAEWQNLKEAYDADEEPLYREIFQKIGGLANKWHVVVDPGCGATYGLAPAILKELGCKITVLNAQPDGFFPARSPEPNAQSLTSLAGLVKILKADLGVAFDGDGDRVAFVTSEGEFVDFDAALAAYAGRVSERRNAGTIVTSVEASMCVERMVEARSGKVVRTRVGDVHISREMKKRDSIFGGEPCGAWIHPQFHYCPDGILSAALMLKTLDDRKTSLSNFISEVPRYPILRENVTVESALKNRTVEVVGDELKSVFPKYKELSTIDGVRLTFDNGWLLIRASGTEPLVRLTVEADSLKAARAIMEKGAIAIKKAIGRCRT